MRLEMVDSGAVQPDRLLKADSATIALSAEKDGRIRMRVSALTEPVVFLPRQSLVLVWRDGQLHLMRDDDLERPAPAAEEADELNDFTDHS